MKYKLLLLLLVFAKGFSQNAILDNTFGVNGKVTTSLGLVITGVIDLEIQTDGKIVTLGNINSYLGLSLVRYNVDGTLDLTFGNMGKVLNTDFFQCRSSNFILTQDNKIIIAASRRLGELAGEDILLIRYNTNGTLDTSFGLNGYVVTDVGASSERCSDILIQSDNKILLTLNTTIDDVIVLRYNYNGSTDSAFGLNGIFQLNLGSNTTTQSNENVSSIALQSDGKLILGGGTDVNNVPEQWDAFLIRLNVDGNIDTSFGTNGVVVTNFDGRDGFSNINVFNDNSIIATGYSFGVNYTSKIILSKFNGNGMLDSSFGSNGKVTTQTNNPNLFDICLDAKIQNDGKVLCFGQNGRGYNFDGGISQPSDMLLLRYNPDGSLDTTFSPTGYITTSFEDNIYNTGRALAIQSDGKIVASGSTLNTTTGQSFALARYTYDNLATNSFSSNENLKIAPNPAHDFLTILGNQKIEQISIVDCTGKIVFNQYTNENKIDVSSLQSGIYFMKIVANDKVFKQKFVKE